RGVREAARFLEIHVRAVFEEDLCGVKMTEERGQAERREALRAPGVHARPGLPQDRLETSRVPCRRGLVEAQRVFVCPFEEEPERLVRPMVHPCEHKRPV